MKGSRFLPVAIILSVLLALSAGLGAAQGPAPQGQVSPQAMVGSIFTYQGQLMKDGNPINATCAMTFTLYDDLAAGNLVGSPLNATVDVSGGLFTQALDFGSSIFTGDARWLEIAVLCPGDASPNTLAPRQTLTAAPYALSLQPGATISGTVSGNTLAVINSVPDFPAVGMYGESRSNFYGYGVYGYTPANNGWAVGVAGETDSPNGAGVVGWGLNEGVYGLAQASSGVTYGVYGHAESTAGRAIYGYASATSGATYGVFAEVDSTGGRGVWGHATATTGTTIGVWGWSDSLIGTGVNGRANASTGINRGVFGLSYSTQGSGVVGVGGAESGTNYGVYGSTASPNGYGVYYVGGLGGTGLKTSIVETPGYGWRHLYSMESPDVLFEDVGTAQLVNGAAVVPIEPIFAQTVNLEQPYQVFLTPQGSYCALYVAEKTPTSFTVRAQEGASCDIAFDYRIVAKRLGYEDVRLAPAADPTLIDQAMQDAVTP